jgi:hypothetical protein
VINTLTGLPVPEDVLLYCIPMAAPYSAIHNYKYKTSSNLIISPFCTRLYFLKIDFFQRHKVKLIPGTTKKGQGNNY